MMDSGLAEGIGMTSLRTRERLVQRLRADGIVDERVLDAIRRVPRHLLIDEALASRAYEDTALPIGYGQTISQPYIVARMTEALCAGRTLRRVLEIGTGSGYQTAVLARLAEEVYSIERLEPLLRTTRTRLLRIGIRNLHYKLGDGTRGWADHAPYDGIIVTAAPSMLPQELIGQLAIGARLVIPVGTSGAQQLMVIERTETGHVSQELQPVSFVPLVEDEA
ncbi:MAG: protein-L-isoaspartate O-methyltransferase [Candidatus Muproteobacteria bacterium RBG_16_60_9]|uniref:Protein-L-isoaspartate O-methyltransferase n=1 Tax=Candidatus Muproteobacteria bacterium RBG_16_60_9 TaxID=1817755 RepID=A0A1F6UY26_9PROT|nr:MAG: protein-L-isoaspartate O-methyltransferase [Candidatus Muproteobacteria bacterium RBG_16_60_9]